MDLRVRGEFGRRWRWSAAVREGHLFVVVAEGVGWRGAWSGEDLEWLDGSGLSSLDRRGEGVRVEETERLAGEWCELTGAGVFFVDEELDGIVEGAARVVKDGCGNAEYDALCTANGDLGAQNVLQSALACFLDEQRVEVVDGRIASRLLDLGNASVSGEADVVASNGTVGVEITQISAVLRDET